MKTEALFTLSHSFIGWDSTILTIVSWSILYFPLLKERKLLWTGVRTIWVLVHKWAKMNTQAQTEALTHGFLFNSQKFTGLVLTWDDIVVAILFLIAGQGTRGFLKLFVDCGAEFFKFYLEKRSSWIRINRTTITARDFVQEKPKQLKGSKIEWERTKK